MNNSLRTIIALSGILVIFISCGTTKKDSVRTPTSGIEKKQEEDEVKKKKKSIYNKHVEEHNHRRSRDRY